MCGKVEFETVHRPGEPFEEKDRLWELGTG